MKVLRRLVWSSAKFWLGTIAIVAAALAVARDTAPTNAASTEIFVSVSGGSPPTWASTGLLVTSNGDIYGNTPCDPGDHNPATLCLYFWAKDVSNATGASAFQVHFTYPDDMIAVSGVSAIRTWLGSSSRSVACAAPVLNPGDVVVSCNTLLAPPPYGATGSGVLATVALSSKATVGFATVNLSTDTFLLDTPVNPNSLAQIPATVRSTVLFVAPCADFNADNLVKANDILYVVSKFHSSDPRADLDGSGLVTASDILVVVREYNWTCAA